MDKVRSRVSAAVRKVIVPKDLAAPHPVVRKLLAEDEARRAKVRESPYLAQYYPQLYDTAPRRRCLRILSAVLQAVTSQGCRADTYGTAPRDGPVEHFAVSAFRQTVRLRASVVEVRHRSGKGADAKTTVERRVRMSLDPGDGRTPDGQAWEDGERTLERQARDIAVAVIVKAEEQLRADAAQGHAWKVRRHAEVLQQMREERERAKRAERERQAEAERVRVERLIGEASALQQAREIRGYVEEVRAANRDAADPVPGAEMDAWAEWALAQADRIDPSGAGRSGSAGATRGRRISAAGVNRRQAGGEPFRPRTLQPPFPDVIPARVNADLAPLPMTREPVTRVL